MLRHVVGVVMHNDEHDRGPVAWCGLFLHNKISRSGLATQGKPVLCVFVAVLVVLKCINVVKELPSVAIF